MITAKEAEKRAHALIENYVNGAGCGSTEDIANVLMKLASMAGLAMAAVAGREEAVARMNACTVNVASAEVLTPHITAASSGTQPH